MLTSIKRFRLERDLKQKDMQAILAKHGYTVTVSYIGTVERGERNPPFEMLQALYDEFGDINWVFEKS